jgi:hypothetical protein
MPDAQFGGRGHARDVRASTAIDDDAVHAELLDNARSANSDASLLKDSNTMLGSRGTAACATSLWTCLPRHTEAVQVERNVGYGYIQARYSRNSARHVAYQLAVLSDGHRCRDRSTDLGRLDGPR